VRLPGLKAEAIRRLDLLGVLGMDFANVRERRVERIHHLLEGEDAVVTWNDETSTAFDSIQQLHTVPNRGDAKLLQVLVRQARENRLVYVILAEDGLILPEAQAPQPDHDVHDGALRRIAVHHCRRSRPFVWSGERKP